MASQNRKTTSSLAKRQACENFMGKSTALPPHMAKKRPALSNVTNQRPASHILPRNASNLLQHFDKWVGEEWEDEPLKAIELMFVDVLLKLDDSILKTIEADEADKLKESRELIRRIRRRDSYRSPTHASLRSYYPKNDDSEIIIPTR